METIFLPQRWLQWWLGIPCRREEGRLPLHEKLGRRKVLSVPSCDEMSIRCVEGTVWITGIGEGGDVILRKGRNILGGRRRVVIEALEDSVIELVPV
jgi:hypothetical protein